MLSTGSTFYLDDLQSLQTVTVPKLSSTKDFFISNTPNLTSFDLDVLRNVTTIYVNNVALSEFPHLQSVSKIASFTARGLNNVSEFILDTTSIGLMDIQGNGTLGVILIDTLSGNSTVPAPQVSTIDKFNVFGCRSIFLPNVTISTFNSTGNNFTTLNLDQVRDMKSIYVIDSPLLVDVVFPKASVLDTLAISNNPLLTDSVFWGAWNTTSISLTGAMPASFV